MTFNIQEEYDRLVKNNEMLWNDYQKLEDEYKELQEKNRKLKVELSVYKSNLKSAKEEIKLLKNMQFASIQKKQRQITDEQVQQIKDLRAEGMSYAKITKETGWSSVTINRVLNGIYDI